MTNYVENIQINGINYPVGGTAFDGQWVMSVRDLLSNVSINSGDTAANRKWVSLSSYLPDDGHDYEILLHGSASTGATSGNSVRLKVLVPPSDTTIDTYLWGGRTRTASTHTGSGCTRVIISKDDRRIGYCNTGSATATGVYSTVYAYRRIGNNNFDNPISNIQDGSNIYSFGGNTSNGLWTVSSRTLQSETSMAANATKTFSLADYLPNDEHDYEVLFSATAKTTSTSGAQAECRLQLSSTANFNITRCQTRGSSYNISYGSIIFPIFHNNKSITISTRYACSISCSISAYRRIGTNI